jgi:hypothetical protein
LNDKLECAIVLNMRWLHEVTSLTRRQGEASHPARDPLPGGRTPPASSF